MKKLEFRCSRYGPLQSVINNKEIITIQIFLFVYIRQVKIFI